MRTNIKIYTSIHPPQLSFAPHLINSYLQDAFSYTIYIYLKFQNSSKHRTTMAPSVQQIPEQLPSVSLEKLEIMKKEVPKVKRQIETEGGKTDAKVQPLSNPILTSRSD